VTLPRATARLVIREYRLSDLDDVARVLGDPLVALDDEGPMTRSESLAWLREEMEHTRRDHTGRYAIALRGTGGVIGGCGLVRRELDGGVETELGYHVRSDLWGRGLATEAAAACLEEARERGVSRVIAFIEPGNARSEAVARRVGMLPGETVTWFGKPHVRWQSVLRD
jgi:RimJ/RimL family protein N-acetyltransferase